MRYVTEVVVGSCVVGRQSRKSLQGSRCDSVSMQHAYRILANRTRRVDFAAGLHSLY